MTDGAKGTADLIPVPEFRGMQALNAWLPDTMSGYCSRDPAQTAQSPLLNGIVVAQAPEPGNWLHRRDVVTVWPRDVPGLGGVREPRHPYPPNRTAAAELPGPPVDAKQR